MWFPILSLSPRCTMAFDMDVEVVYAEWFQNEMQTPNFSEVEIVIKNNASFQKLHRIPPLAIDLLWYPILETTIFQIHTWSNGQQQWGEEF